MPWYTTDDARRHAENQAAKDRDASRKLGNLLAVIYRDGGHYQNEHGTDKAIADAADAFRQLIRYREDMVARVAELKKSAYQPKGLPSDWAETDWIVPNDEYQKIIAIVST